MLALWNDEAYVRSLMSDYPFLTEEIFNSSSRILLEGYLFPETYNFFVDADADQITRKILDQTLKVYNDFADQFAQSELSIHQLFTLASIVQYEAAKPSDMQLVAGVFYNRLHAGMKLQSSVTVCYAIDKEKDDDWMACEVNPDFDSPYNTYRVEGLPPGPILNPGTGCDCGGGCSRRQAIICILWRMSRGMERSIMPKPMPSIRPMSASI